MLSALSSSSCRLGAAVQGVAEGASLGKSGTPIPEVIVNVNRRALTPLATLVPLRCGLMLEIKLANPERVRFASDTPLLQLDQVPFGRSTAPRWRPVEESMIAMSRRPGTVPYVVSMREMEPVSQISSWSCKHARMGRVGHQRWRQRRGQPCPTKAACRRQPLYHTSLLRRRSLRLLGRPGETRPWRGVTVPGRSAFQGNQDA